MSKNLRAALATAALTLTGSLALAQSTPPQVIRGTIASVNGNAISLTMLDGTTTSVSMQPGAHIVEIIPSSLAAVKAGSYVGTAAIPMPNGELRAMELQVFPASMRGVGEGTRAWNLAPKSTMTNGTVGSMQHAAGTVGSMSGSGNMTITIGYGSGVKTVIVPQGVPVVTYAPGNPEDVKPGAHVLLFATKSANGTLVTNRISVGKNGLTPPM